jgi:hypothetical protein
MSMSDILKAIEKVLLVSPYYSEWESQFSIAVSVIAAVVGGVIGKFVVRPNRNPAWIIVLIVLLVATFLCHWLYLYDAGGVFYWQLACRAVFFLCLGMLGLSFGKAEGDGDEQD